MTFTAVLLLFLAVAALLAARRNVKGAPVIVLLAAIGAFAFLAISFIQARRNSPENQRVTGETATGLVLGRQLAAEIQNGTVLVIRNAPRKNNPNDITALRFNGLQTALGKSGVQFLQAGPNMANLGSDDPAFLLLPDETFDRDLQKIFTDHKDIKAVVNLRGTVTPVPAGIPLYGFFDQRDTGWIARMRADHIKAGIVFRNEPLPHGTAPEANNGLPLHYILVTKTTLDDALKQLGL